MSSDGQRGSVSGEDRFDLAVTQESVESIGSDPYARIEDDAGLVLGLGCPAGIDEDGDQGRAGSFTGRCREGILGNRGEGVRLSLPQGRPRSIRQGGECVGTSDEGLFDDLAVDAGQEPPQAP
ncbi:MAG: hypothetical protein GXP34_07160 [Actinobacteria bacterium]|nr:hypothetical protein [Actinomycetota bacterium]